MVSGLEQVQTFGFKQIKTSVSKQIQLFNRAYQEAVQAGREEEEARPQQAGAPHAQKQVRICLENIYFFKKSSF